MVAEDSDDLWYAYNLIAVRDSVMAVTFRKVQREVPGGGRDSERVRLKLEVQVEEVDYDKDAAVLRIPCVVSQIGAFHTLEIELKRPFVLRKGIWDSLALDTLKQASDPAASADLAVVLMQEGLGQIFLVGRSQITMKIVRRDFVRNGPGSVKMVAEDSDDLWYAYNLIAVRDSVMAVTFRKVQREVPGGGRDSERVRLKLEVQVEEVDYDKDAAVLRIRGKNILENDHVKIGAFHTLEIELKRPFVLRKGIWDSLALDTLKQASDPAASADLAVVLMQEGLGQIFLVGRRYYLL
ncbi:hypothetical protein F2Q68_00037493 [Brassica cretica]|uniref:eRF1/Pelota-like N-terminal domain-containing protein n=1 Tax=Brassica cretica TaxID=69181 RepID=A0A8S9H4X5_BRACR|nr:hypothetical protein F2Q68_00037493 [Brassica cretica]